MKMQQTKFFNVVDSEQSYIETPKSKMNP